MTTYQGERQSELEPGLREVAPQSLISIVMSTMENKVIPNPILPAAGVRYIAVDGGVDPPSGGHYDDETSNLQGNVLADHCTRSIH